MRFRPEAAGESGQGWRERVQKYPCRTCSGTTCGLPHEVIAILNRMFRPGQQPGFAAAPAQTGLLSKPKKTASLKCPPNEGVC